MQRRDIRLTAIIVTLVVLDIVLWTAIVPILPRWQRELGLSKFETGVLVSAYSAATLVALPVGRYADRLGPRRMTVAAAFAFAVVAPLLGIVHGFWPLVAVRAAQGVFSAVSWTAGAAWISRRVPDESRGRALSSVNAGASGAAALGPFIGGPVVSAFGLRTTTAVYGAVVLVVAVLALRERDEGEQAVHEVDRGMFAAIAHGLREPHVRAAFILLGFAALCSAAVQLLAPLALGDGGMSSARIGMIFTIGAIFSTLATILIGRNVLPRRRLVASALATAVFGAGIVLLALPLATVAFAAVLVVSLTMTGPLYALPYPMCADGADRAGIGQGIAFGALNFVWGVCALIGPLVAGLIASVSSDAPVYVLLGALGIVVVASLRRAQAEVLATES